MVRSFIGYYERVNIGNGSIVGMCSLVTKNIPSNCVVAGIPSQIVKEDIYWEK